jgi:hypothetical protein
LESKFGGEGLEQERRGFSSFKRKNSIWNLKGCTVQKHDRVYYKLDRVFPQTGFGEKSDRVFIKHDRVFICQNLIFGERKTRSGKIKTRPDIWLGFWWFGTDENTIEFIKNTIVFLSVLRGSLAR